jgi:hypothetical protein
LYFFAFSNASPICKREVLIQLLLFTNYYLSLFFLERNFAFVFFFVIKCEVFEGTQQQSSSKLIKDFLSLFYFFKACIGFYGDQAYKFPLPKRNFYKNKMLESSNKIKARRGIATLILLCREVHCKLLNHSTFS